MFLSYNSKQKEKAYREEQVIQKRNELMAAVLETPAFYQDAVRLKQLKQEKAKARFSAENSTQAERIDTEINDILKRAIAAIPNYEANQQKFPRALRQGSFSE